METKKCYESIKQFFHVAKLTISQSLYMINNEVFKFDPNVSFNDSRVYNTTS